MSSEPRRYICERCGGKGQQVDGLWNTVTQKYDAPAGVCDGCKGTGYLGVIEQPIDLDALAAIVEKRTPGELNQLKNMVFVASNGFALCLTSADAAAIVAAVNAIGPLIERCKRAEAERDDANVLVSRYAKQIIRLDDEVADLTRQRDELLHLVDQVRLNTDQPHIREACRELHNRMKGGTDGT